MIRRVLIVIAALTLVAATARGQSELVPLPSLDDAIARSRAASAANAAAWSGLRDDMTSLLAMERQTTVMMEAVSTSLPPGVANVCLVQCPDGSSGSGCYLGCGLVLSCYHTFRDSGQWGCRIEFPDGSEFGGQCIRADRTWDQTLIQLDAVPQLAGVPLADSDPQIGDTLSAVGYAFARRYQVASGPVTSYVYADRAGAGPADWINMRGGATPGMSGGPMFNATGRLVGNLWGTRAGTTTGCTTRRTLAFLEPHREQLEAHAQEMGWGVPGPGGVRRVGPATTCPPPIVQPVQPTVPYVQPPQPQPQPNIDEIVAKLKADQAFIAAVRGPQGQPGPAGEKGMDGKDGADGTSPDNAKVMTALESLLARIERVEQQVANRPSGGKLTKVHVDATGRIYATYDDQTQEVVGEIPWIKTRDGRGQLYYEIVPRSPK